MHVDPVVGVADGRVQLGEVVALRLHGLRDLLHPASNERRVHRCTTPRSDRQVL